MKTSGLLNSMSGGATRKASRATGLLAMIAMTALLSSPAAEISLAPKTGQRYALVPGVVIDCSPASTRAYIGSPSIAVLPNGDYVASHDFFGPGSSNNRTAVFRSGDRGKLWKKVAEIEGQWWSTLFVHRAALYLLGTSREYGDVVIRRSRDEGETWTTPTNQATGRLRDDGQYHCAPTPLLEHRGRLWRGIERREPPTGWGVNFRAGMMSARVDADLIDSASWTFSNFLPGDTNWLGGGFGGWLEGNAVATRDGRLLDILRVDTPGCPEKAALVQISSDGRVAVLDTPQRFIDFPGGAKKFTIRYDAASEHYWSLATVTESLPRGSAAVKRPAGIRNTLALTCSSDLIRWEVRRILLHHPDTLSHGFQYVDWLFDGDDLIAVCRTAFDDQGGQRAQFPRRQFPHLPPVCQIPLPEARRLQTFRIKSGLTRRLCFHPERTAPLPD